MFVRSKWQNSWEEHVRDLPRAPQPYTTRLLAGSEGVCSETFWAPRLYTTCLLAGSEGVCSKRSVCF